MVTRKSKPTEPKPLKLRLTLKVQIEGQQGLDEFARLLRVLQDNGYKETVRRMTRELVKVADKGGIAVPAHIRAFIEAVN